MMYRPVFIVVVFRVSPPFLVLIYLEIDSKDEANNTDRCVS